MPCESGRSALERGIGLLLGPGVLNTAMKSPMVDTLASLFAAQPAWNDALE